MPESTEEVRREDVLREARERLTACCAATSLAARDVALAAEQLAVIREPLEAVDLRDILAYLLLSVGPDASLPDRLRERWDAAAPGVRAAMVRKADQLVAEFRASLIVSAPPPERAEPRNEEGR